jgi:hypothetical protein
MPSCPDCGKMNKDQVKFCVFCGGKLTRTETGTKSSAYIIGIALIFIGLIPLGLGFSNIYSATTMEQMDRGTILEDDPDTRTIIDNTRSMGTTELAIGVLIVIVGAGCMYYARWGFSIPGNTPSASVGSTRPQRKITSASAKPKQKPGQVKCPFCASTTYHVVEETGHRRCSDCHSDLPSFIRGNR